jgi:hypothetical protein
MITTGDQLQQRLKQRQQKVPPDVNQPADMHVQGAL